MRLCKVVLYAGLAFVVCALGTPAMAGTVVISDQGAGLVDVTGLTGGAQVQSEPGSMLTFVNGNAVTGLTMNIGQVAITSFDAMSGIDVITGGVGTKVIKDGSGNEIILHLLITGGFADKGMLVIDSTIQYTIGTPSLNIGAGSGIGAPYNFTSLVGGTMILVDTDASVDFTTILGVAGAKTTGGALSVAEFAVPEPTSLALLGIGMASFFAYRRLFKRTVVA